MLPDRWLLWTFIASASIVLCWVLQRVLQWFATLNVSSAQSASGRFLEDPASLKKEVAPSLFSDATKSLSVVVPAYNEEQRIAPMLDETLGYLQHRRDRQGPHFTYEVVIVDDGSSDGTRQVVFDYIRRHGLDAVRLIQQPANMGKGAAVKAGVLCARGEQILFADADGATGISCVEALEQKLGEAAKDRRGVAVGSRAHMQQEALSRRHPLRNFLMHGFHVLVMLVVGGAIRDTQCGFKLMTRGAARELFSNTRLQRWCFDVELIFLAQQLRIPVVEVPVDWTEIPGSKIKATSIIHMAWELVAILAGYRWLRLWTIMPPGSRTAHVKG